MMIAMPSLHQIMCFFSCVSRSQCHMLAQLHLAFAGGSTGHRGAYNDTWAKLHVCSPKSTHNKNMNINYKHNQKIDNECDKWISKRSAWISKNMNTCIYTCTYLYIYRRTEHGTKAWHGHHFRNLSSFHILSNSANGWTSHCTVGFLFSVVSRTWQQWHLTRIIYKK